MFPAVQSQITESSEFGGVGVEAGSVKSVDGAGLWSHIAGKAVAREGRTTPPEHGSDALRRGSKEGVAARCIRRHAVDTRATTNEPGSDSSGPKSH